MKGAPAMAILCGNVTMEPHVGPFTTYCLNRRDWAAPDVAGCQALDKY